MRSSGFISVERRVNAFVRLCLIHFFSFHQYLYTRYLSANKQPINNICSIIIGEKKVII